MIGQYLPNNNEKRYRTILPKISNLNRPIFCTCMVSNYSDNGTTSLTGRTTTWFAANAQHTTSPKKRPWYTTTHPRTARTLPTYPTHLLPRSWRISAAVVRYVYVHCICPCSLHRNDLARRSRQTTATRQFVMIVASLACSFCKATQDHEDPSRRAQ
jgi:hypothetical protein